MGQLRIIAILKVGFYLTQVFRIKLRSFNRYFYSGMLNLIVYANQIDYNVILITRVEFEAACHCDREILKLDFSSQWLRYTRLRKSRVHLSHFMERRNLRNLSVFPVHDSAHISHSTGL